MILFDIVLFFIGAALGSFIGVIIDRLPRQKSFLHSRSICGSCHKKLEPIDLIPVLSYLMFQGKCRRCKAPIPTRLLILEVLSGLLLIFLFYTTAASFLQMPLFIFSGIVVYSLIAIFYIDLDYGIIPDEILIFLGIVACLYFGVFDRGVMLSHLLSAIGSCLFFLMLFLITKGKGMGFGDVKFAFIIGLLTGFPGVIVSLYLAFLTGAAISLILIISKRKKIHGSTIPFGPFLVIGTIAGLFYGNQLWELFFRIYH